MKPFKQFFPQIISPILKIPLAEQKFILAVCHDDSRELCSSWVPWCKTVHRSRPRCSTGPRTAFGRKREKKHVSAHGRRAEKHLSVRLSHFSFRHMQISRHGVTSHSSTRQADINTITLDFKTDNRGPCFWGWTPIKYGAFLS